MCRQKTLFVNSNAISRNAGWITRPLVKGAWLTLNWARCVPAIVSQRASHLRQIEIPWCMRTKLILGPRGGVPRLQCQCGSLPPVASRSGPVHAFALERHRDRRRFCISTASSERGACRARRCETSGRICLLRLRLQRGGNSDRGRRALPGVRIVAAPIVAAAAMALSSVSVVGNALRLRTVRI
jgi:hypothetical protein